MKKNRPILLTFFLSLFLFNGILAQQTDTTKITKKNKKKLGVFVGSKSVNFSAYDSTPPEIQFLNQEDTVYQKEYPLYIEVNSSYGIQEVKAKVNGVEIDLDPLFLTEEVFRQQIEQDSLLVRRGVDNSGRGKVRKFRLRENPAIGKVDTLKLPMNNGHNLISISISNDGKAVKDTSFNIFYEHRPVLHLVTIGISKYLHNKNRSKGQKSDMKDLKYPMKDALAIQKAYYTQKHLYRDIKDYHLINEDATRENIMDLIDKKLAPSVHENDKVVLFFAAHGVKENEKQDVLFAPYNFDSDRKASTGIFWYNITKPIKNLDCNSLLIFDACHSGNLEGNPKQNELGNTIKPYIGDKMIVLSASFREAFEHYKWGHGALTKAILEVFSNEVDKKFAPDYQDPNELMSENTENQLITTFELMSEIAADGLVDKQELERYVVHRVPELVSKESGVQRPACYGTADFTLYEIPTKKQISVKH